MRENPNVALGRRSVWLVATAVMEPGVEPDVAFVPPLHRRRLSPLQKRFFSLARQVDAPDDAVCVFASCDGEDGLTRRTVTEYRSDGTVSPARFSSSVYNAAPGLWSVFTHNRAPYTAIAADADSIECGLIEALRLADGDLRLADGRIAQDLLYVCAEETGGGFGAAARFSTRAVPGAWRVFVMPAGAGDAAASGQSGLSVRSAGCSLSFSDWCAFLSGAKDRVIGRFLSAVRTRDDAGKIPSR